MECIFASIVELKSGNSPEINDFGDSEIVAREAEIISAAMPAPINISSNRRSRGKQVEARCGWTDAIALEGSSIGETFLSRKRKSEAAHARAVNFTATNRLSVQTTSQSRFALPPLNQLRVN